MVIWSCVGGCLLLCLLLKQSQMTLKIKESLLAIRDLQGMSSGFPCLPGWSVVYFPFIEKTIRPCVLSSVTLKIFRV